MNYKITNQSGIPEPMSTILKNYILKNIDKSPFTVSSLSQKPVQVIALQNKFKTEIQYDVSEFYNMWRGSAIHAYLEGLDKSAGNVVNETYKFIVGGIEITGTIDSFNPKSLELIDYKYTQKKQGSNFTGYAKQLDFYEAAMLLDSGIILEKKTLKVLRSNATVFDSSPVIYDVDVPLCNLRETIKTITLKSSDILKSLKLSPEELATKYPCSDEDMWIDTYVKVKKDKASKSYSGGVFNVSDYNSLDETFQAAQSFLDAKGEGIITTTKTEPKRCNTSWCPGRMFCMQHKLKNENEKIK